MEKPPVGGNGLPPRFTTSFAIKPEPSPSPDQRDTCSAPTSLSHDLSRMPDFPPRSCGHRRAHSEILTLPADVSFDSDLGFVGSGADGPSLSDETDEDLFSMFIDIEKIEKLAASCATSAPCVAENVVLISNEKPKIRHHHSQSMDGSMTLVKPEMLGSGNEGGAAAGVVPEPKKPMTAQQLAELAVLDPKRAKRIWANRQSAARSKERKMRYIQELERKVQTLQTEATTLSTQLSMLQRDTNGLTAENNELKLRLQTVEQQVHLQDALNEALREEVHRLKMVTGQLTSGQGIPNGRPMIGFGASNNYGMNQQFYNHNQAMQSLLATQKLQQLQIHSQQQQQQLQTRHNQLQQQLNDLKMKGVVTSPNQNETESDSNGSSKE